MAIPKIAGYEGEYEYPKIHVPIYLIYNELKELQENKKLARSKGWLSSISKNLSTLEKNLSIQEENLPLLLVALRNWFHTVKEGKKSLAEVLDTLRDTGFEDLSSLQKYMETLVNEDPEGLHCLLHYLERALESDDL